MNDEKKKDDGPTFEEELQKLEGTVKELETGKLGLDESLERFEEGVKLTRSLRARLSDAKGRVEELLETGEKKELDVE